MHEQGKLFPDQPPKKETKPDICRNRHKGEKFSERANEQVHKHKSNQRGKILKHLGEVGGAMAEEVEDNLQMSRSSVSARMSELKKLGLIVPVIDKDGNQVERKTKSGGWGGVYKPAPMIGAA